MDRLIRLIHTLDSEEVSTASKYADIKLYRNEGVITDEEAVDLITAYNIKKDVKAERS